MKKNNMDEIFYSLCVQDIQNVAEQELNRQLSTKEIEMVKEKVDEKIDWYSVIADSINECLALDVE